MCICVLLCVGVCEIKGIFSENKGCFIDNYTCTYSTYARANISLSPVSLVSTETAHNFTHVDTTTVKNTGINTIRIKPTDDNESTLCAGATIDKHD